MIVKFSKKEIDFLNNHLSKESEYFKLIFVENKEVEVDNDLADEIRDWAGEKQQIIGYDENYELTDLGKVLESVIDKLYH
ncbi:hypothetical protein [Flavobacterium microcysteis]|uniref:Uncharacterized protein n=1 Tax=Flavobacterium microcysteis TaxID=2596891 RepID=A0A501QMQ7_9FLAO|nr:hypothetical protein [Flavobacterium microcysteis]TPD73754.1 hypothetical protein FJA49_00220 [Flavobacterium microcysteis]